MAAACEISTCALACAAPAAASPRPVAPGEVCPPASGATGGLSAGLPIFMVFSKERVVGPSPSNMDGVSAGVDPT